MENIDRITEAIIGCVIEVHRVLGPGLYEGIYEAALCRELEAAGLRFVRQAPVAVLYKGHVVGEYRVDLLVEGLVIVEAKAVSRIEPIFEAQVLTYLRATGKRVGLLINFNSRLLKEGIRRLVL